MEQFAAYSHAIVSVAVFVILTLLLGPVSAVRKAGAGVTAGGTPAEDYGSPVYRLHRAYMNATESVGPFAAAVAMAILAGANPFWINMLASVFLVARILVLVVHVAGVGAMNQGLRSIVFGIGLFCTVAIALMAIVAAF